MFLIILIVPKKMIIYCRKVKAEENYESSDVVLVGLVMAFTHTALHMFKNFSLYSVGGKILLNKQY